MAGIVGTGATLSIGRQIATLDSGLTSTATQRSVLIRLNTILCTWPSLSSSRLLPHPTTSQQTDVVLPAIGAAEERHN
jgi:hypothetical protein